MASPVIFPETYSLTDVKKNFLLTLKLLLFLCSFLSFPFLLYDCLYLTLPLFLLFYSRKSFSLFTDFAGNFK